MALKLIIDSDTVIQRMALKDIDEVRDTIDSSLNAVHVLLQGILNTTFEPVTSVKEVFYLEDGVHPKNINTLITCKLTQAFVWASSVSVTYSESSRKDLAANPLALPATDYLVDYKRGYVLIEEDYQGDWVEITYSAGFDSTHKAPEWLQEAALAYMPMLLSEPSGGINVSTLRALLEVHKTVQEEVGKMVEPYLRNRAFQFLPVIW